MAALTVRGAQSHRVSDSIVQSAKMRKLAAKSAQKMVIAVLTARFAAEHAQATEAIDRGSELGNFDTEPSIPKICVQICSTMSLTWGLYLKR